MVECVINVPLLPVKVLTKKRNIFLFEILVIRYIYCYNKTQHKICICKIIKIIK